MLMLDCNVLSSCEIIVGRRSPISTAKRESSSLGASIGSREDELKFVVWQTHQGRAPPYY
jgi:hypothetical protein